MRPVGGNDKILNVADVSGDLGSVPDVDVFGPVKTTRPRSPTSPSETVWHWDRTSSPWCWTSPSTAETAARRSTSPSSTATRAACTASTTGLSVLRVSRTFSECATGGSRVLAVLTQEDFGAQNVQAFGLDKGENIVAVIDVLDVMPAKASGALQFNDARGLPSVVRAPDGTPGIIIPDVPAPTEIVTQTAHQGRWPEGEEGDIVVSNIMGVGWDDKTVTTSSWGKDASVSVAAEQLVGATVGSQLLVVFPAAESAPATAIVVDILGAVTAPTQ